MLFCQGISFLDQLYSGCFYLTDVPSESAGLSWSILAMIELVAFWKKDQYNRRPESPEILRLRDSPHVCVQSHETFSSTPSPVHRTLRW